MAYELHIERKSGIEISEWLSAVNQTSGVRVNNSDVLIRNPETNEEISISSGEGDADIWVQSINDWQRVYRFHSGRISFRASEQWQDHESEVREITFQLAAILRAKVVGDEGEEYYANDQNEVAKYKPWWQVW